MPFVKKVKDTLEYNIKDLHDTISLLRKKPELGELCFRVYLSYEDTYQYRSELEKEAKAYGYNLYFKAGKAGTTLGMLKDLTSDYWE